MSAHAASKEIVQLIALKENDPQIEQKRLRNGDLLIRNAIGDSLTLTNGMQISLRQGYFTLTAASDVTVERGKNGMTCIIFANGDEVKFDDKGIHSLKRGMLLFQFTRKEAFDHSASISGALHSASVSVMATTQICVT